MHCIHSVLASIKKRQYATTSIKKYSAEQFSSEYVDVKMQSNNGELNQREKGMLQLRYLIYMSLLTGCSSAISADTPNTSILIHDRQLPLTDRTGVTLRRATHLPLSELSTRAKPHQVEPFNAVIDVDFDPQLTVGEAMHRVLNFIGYDLFVAGLSIDPAAETLFSRPLPHVHRAFENTRVKDVLSALVGHRYIVVVDHNIRAVTADLSPAIRRYLKAEYLHKQ